MRPILVDLIRFYCLIFIIIGFSTVQLAILTKKMNFRRITMINSPAIFLGVIIGLYLGYNGFGVWEYNLDVFDNRNILKAYFFGFSQVGNLVLFFRQLNFNITLILAIN